MPHAVSRTLRIALGGALLSAPLVGVLPTPAVAADPTVVSGDDFTVSRVAGGFEVTVDLAKPLPIRSDAPTIVVDGESVGIATESADGRSLSVFTADRSVLGADQVSAGWASQSDPADAVARSAAVDVPESSAARALAEDPSQLGAFDWTESIYLFGDQSVPLAAIGGIRGELEGKTYLPTTGGARPVVILLHGRHTSCYGTGAANPLRWPCATAPDNDLRKSIPSYAGYDGTARALASRGYAVVSISANAINSNDNQLAADQGAQARGQLILDTLAMLREASLGSPVSYYDAWKQRTVDLDQALSDGAASYAVRSEGFVGGAPPLDTVRASDFVGRFDFSSIGLMGHSRGGEGVTSAATLNQALPDPWAIKSILPLAPVDFGRMSVPNVPMNVLLPYCDGDVSNQQGQHMLDDSRYAFSDDALRSGTWVMGANHNFYNTVWTPGRYSFSVSDDWSNSTARTNEPTCGTSPAVAATSIRMTAAEQYAQGTSYMTAWFRLTLGGEQQFLPMFDGTGEVPAALGGEDVRTVATAPSSARSTITSFEDATSVTAVGTATATPCASLGGRTTPQVLPACATTSGSAQVPHWTPASNATNVPATPLTRMAWTSATGEVRVAVPEGRRDASGFQRLSVKLAADETVATGTALTIGVVDGSGATWSSPVSALNPLALVRFPTSASTAATTTLKKIVLQQVNVPLATLRSAGLATSDLREVRFTAATGADGTASGAAYLSDLALERSSVGTPTVATEPVIDVYAPSVDEGSAPGSVDLAVYLDGPADEPVTGYVSLLGSTTSRAGATMKAVTFAPGETCIPVTASLQGDELPSTNNGSSLKASVVNTAGAVMGKQSIVFTTIREDDGVTGTAVALPPVGTPGPVCAELAGVRAGGTVVAPDNTVPGNGSTVTAAGFRAGESVTFTASGLAPATVLADPSGVATAVLGVPLDAPRGFLTVDAVGAGTGRVATGSMAVRSLTTTSIAISPEVPQLRQPVTLTATVSGADEAATVEFFDGAESLGTAPTTGGRAVLTVPGFGPGQHVLTAAYGSTQLTFRSTSTPIGFTLERSVPTIVLSLSTPSPTFGTAVVADVVVGGASEGEVELTAGGTTVTLPVDADGRASTTLPRLLAAGSYPISAQYTGSDDVAPSTVAEATLTVAKKAVDAEIVAPTRVKAKRTMTVRVRITGTVTGAPATGRVTLVTDRPGRTLVRQLTATSGDVVAFRLPTGKVGRFQLRAYYAGSGSYGADLATPRTVRVVR